MSDNYKFESIDKDGNGIKLEFLPENHEIRQQCQLAYSQAYKYYFSNGAMTRAQAMDIAKENGSLDESWQRELAVCVKELMSLQGEMDKENQKKRPLKKKLNELNGKSTKLFQEYHRLVDKQRDILDPTCENLAENRKIEMSVVLRLIDDNGNHIFKDHAELVSRYGEILLTDAIEHMVFLQNRMPYRMEGILAGAVDTEKAV